MATKIAPKKAVKPEVSAADAKAAAAAATAKLIESLTPRVTKKIVAIKEAEETVSSGFLDLVDDVSEIVEEKGLDKAQTTILVRRSYAEAYDLDLDEVKAGGKGFTQYTNASKVVRFVFPEDAKALAKARDKGFGVNDLYKVATSGKISAGMKKSQGRGGNTKEKSAKKNAFESIEDVGTALAAVISNALKSGFEIDEVEESFASIVAEWNDKAEKAEDTED